MKDHMKIDVDPPSVPRDSQARTHYKSAPKDQMTLVNCTKIPKLT